MLVFEEYSSWYHKQLNQVYAKTGLHLEGHAALKRVHIMYGNEVQLYCARDLKHCIHYGVDAARLTQFINEAQGIPGVQVILYERNKSYMDPEDDFLHVINPNTPEFNTVEHLYRRLDLKEKGSPLLDEKKVERNWRNNFQVSFGFSGQNQRRYTEADKLC